MPLPQVSMPGVSMIGIWSCGGTTDRIPIFFAMRNLTAFIFAFQGIVFLFASGLSCKDKNCPNSLVYHLPVTVTPLSDTFNIGDSLYVDIDFPEELMDINGEIGNTFENFDFKLFISTARYDVPHQYSSQAFDLYTVEGSDTLVEFSSSNEYALTLKYKESKYKYTGYIILKEPGVFAVYFASYYESFTDPLTIRGNCDHLSVHLYCETNDGQNNNVELVSPYNGNSTFWENQFKKGGGYAFVVR
ncbi:MAG: hypothetical protein LCH81_10005 [Bacteroidetes bacterium]|nr:hypothetical protein [Bacteroidota bacterium]